MKKLHVKRNVLLLAFCQALGNTGNIIVFSVSALAGAKLAPDKSLATLPLFSQFLAATLTTIPASFLMKKLGRKTGFMVGSFVACLGGGVAYFSIAWGNFPLFCLGSALLGVLVGFMPYYRFAAVDAADENFKNNAISLTLAGGVLAAVLGPSLADYSVNLFPAEFAGNFFLLLLLPLVGICLLFFVRIAPIAETAEEGSRPLAEIVKQPKFILALLGGMIGYGVMSILMVSTPLSMKHSALTFENITFVIQWHVLGMFVPSFVTGSLIQRFGVYKILFLGALMNVGCVAINLNGTGLYHYWVALILLGVGWNFLFIGASSLLTECYNESEKAAVQAMNEFLVLAVVATSSLFSGVLFQWVGWKMINFLVLPPIIFILLISLWIQFRYKKI
ncbi:MAG: MFS transporter [Proteobacteria bacterium]|nr:MFS transporter [Pseudomonadota bacterium]